MSVVIAGRTVRKDDTLYHTGFKCWGKVIGFDGGSAKISICGANGRERILHVQTGGKVNGKRCMYWHEPLKLDAPYQNIQKLQRVVDALVMEFGDASTD